MPEKVKVQALRRQGPPISVDSRVARHLVRLGRVRYADEGPANAATEPAPAKQAAEDADVVFTPSETLDVKPAKKAKRKGRAYKRRDMKAEGE